MAQDRLIQCEAEVTEVAFSDARPELAGICRDNQVRFWNPSTGALQRTVKWNQDDRRGLMMSTDARLLAAAGNDRIIKLWDLKNGEMTHRLGALPYPPGQIAVSPDGKLLASNAGIEQAVRLWDLPSNRQLFVMVDGLDGSDLLFSPDGQFLVAANSDTNLRIWNTRTGQLVRTLDGLAVSMFAMAFSPDGRILATAGADRVVHIWDTQNWKELRTLTGAPEMIASMACSKDGKLLVTGGFDDVTVANPTSVLLWDVAGSKIIHKWPAPHRVSSVAISAQFGLVAAAAQEKTVRLWQLPVKA